MNRFVDSSNELSIADAAKAADVPETSIKSARTVLADGTPDEIEVGRKRQGEAAGDG